MDNFEHFQSLQRVLVEAAFDTSLDARREQDEAVFSLTVKLHHQTPEKMASLSAITTDNGFAFTIDGDSAAIMKLT
jgi:hypothetical protein